MNYTWSSILKQTPSMPKRTSKRGIFLGTSKNGLLKVVIEGSTTPELYDPSFWELDHKYMGDREEIAYLKGRIDESNEPVDISTYRQEIEDILHGINS